MNYLDKSVKERDLTKVRIILRTCRIVLNACLSAGHKIGLFESSGLSFVLNTHVFFFLTYLTKKETNSKE